MKFVLRKASSFEFKDEVEINTIEELLTLDKQYGSYSLVVDFDRPQPSIYIYDGYLE